MVNDSSLILYIYKVYFFYLKELKESIATVSTTDELTGLHNRKYLQEQLESEIQTSLAELKEMI